ncbi:MAG: FAD-dependent oxidoreductase [Bacilli bacterium]|nr:FAD-dependent oxidoreductase [Bacilli bacterium]
MIYDAIIIGAGPAGLTAAIYLLRANKKVLVLEKETIGGQISSSPLVENYPGYLSISGSELTGNMFDQVLNLGGEVEIEEVIKIIENEVITEDNTYKTKTIIVATGCKPRVLGIDNEENLIGNGIHFCVACDGAFYKDKKVAVIGGGNSAVINAISLSDYCTEVILIQNLDHLTAEQNLIDTLNKKNNVKIILNGKVVSYIGEDALEGFILKNNEEIIVDGLFLSIGQVPNSDFIKEFLDIKNNYIDSDDCLTKYPNVFVAGDVRTKEIRQLTTATSDGTTCAIKAIDYLNNFS